VSKNGEKSKCPSVDTENGDKFLDEYSLDEFYWVLNIVRSKSSLGIDGTDNLVIQNLPEKLLVILLDIYKGWIKSSGNTIVT
jgi:hypothetical protein